MLSRFILELAAMLMQMQIRKEEEVFLPEEMGIGGISKMITILEKMHKTSSVKIIYYWYLGFSFRMVIFEVENTLSFEGKKFVKRKVSSIFLNKNIFFHLCRARVW